MKRQHLLFTVAIFAIIIFITGCASMRVKGSDPISRSISITQLIIDGKTKDSYIEIYLDEIAQANSLINIAIAETNYNPEAYLKIADTIDTWIILNNNLRTLSELYPNGLDGKKLHANFNYTDYQSLKIKAQDFAFNTYFEKAENLYNNKQLSAQARRPAIEYLEKAASYSTKHDAEINSMAAEICYAIGIEESSSTDITTLEDAVDMFTQSENWIPGYKDAFEQITALNTKIANLYITKGDMFFNEKNYSSFRTALKNYNKADSYVRNSATDKIQSTKEALTIKVAYLFGGNSYSYPDDDKIISILQEKLASNSRGPAYIDMNFIHATNSIDILLVNLDDYDLILIPDEKYGQIHEVFGAAKSSQKDIMNTVDNTIYSGSIVEQNQSVTVYKLNKYSLYDTRFNYKKLINTWEWKQDETTKTFSHRKYFGDEEAKPLNFDEGKLYEKGEYTKYFSNLQTNPTSYDFITTPHNSLNHNGQEFADILKNLEYKER